VLPRVAARAANCLARPGGNCSGSGESDRRREFERSNRVNPCLFAVHLGQRFSVRIRRFCTAMDRTRSTRFIVPRGTTSSARLTISVLITNSALGAGSLPALIIPTLSVFPPATARELPSRRSSSFFGWRLSKNIRSSSRIFRYPCGRAEKYPWGTTKTARQPANAQAPHNSKDFPFDLVRIVRRTRAVFLTS
jgi:hypothetical protein